MLENLDEAKDENWEKFKNGANETLDKAKQKLESIKL
jgi:hypothetical protein